jgi:hypothetical protein
MKWLDSTAYHLNDCEKNFGKFNRCSYSTVEELKEPPYHKFIIKLASKKQFTLSIVESNDNIDSLGIDSIRFSQNYSKPFMIPNLGESIFRYHCVDAYPLPISKNNLLILVYEMTSTIPENRYYILFIDELMKDGLINIKDLTNY